MVNIKQTLKLVNFATVAGVVLPNKRVISTHLEGAAPSVPLNITRAYAPDRRTPRRGEWLFTGSLPLSTGTEALWLPHSVDLGSKRCDAADVSSGEQLWVDKSPS